MEIKDIQPLGCSENPQFYVIGHTPAPLELSSGIVFNANAGRGNSLLVDTMNSLNITTQNARFNRLIKQRYEEVTPELKESYVKILQDDILRTNPQVIIGLGSEVAQVLLQDNFKNMASSRGKLLKANIQGKEFPCIITYSPLFLTKEDMDVSFSTQNAEKDFKSDFALARRFIDGGLVNIEDKDLRYAKTFKEFKDYFMEYLIRAERPAYDIESNAKDPRCSDFRIIGYSLAPDPSTGIYVIRDTLEYSMPPEDWEQCVSLTKKYLASRKCLVHNIMYEKPATLNEWDLDITDFDDSMIKARMLLGGKVGAGLKDQCIRNLGYPEWDVDLHTYLNAMQVMIKKLSPTTAGTPRWDYEILESQGFESLELTYQSRSSILEKLGDITSEELTKEMKDLIKSNEMQDRSKEVQEAMKVLRQIITDYYGTPEEVSNLLQLVGKEVINLIDIQHTGIIPYSSIPMKLLAKYGALDAVGTQDLDRFLSNRMDNESTDKVNLWNGYKVMKEHFVVGAYLEMNGLYWDEGVAQKNYDWLAEQAKVALTNCLLSGYLDDLIFEKSQELLRTRVLDEMMDKVEEFLGEFELQKSGIKLTNGKRITFKKLLENLPEEFIQAQKPWVVEEVKDKIRNNEYKTYEDLKELFNPSSAKVVTPILNEVLVTEEIPIGYMIVRIRDLLKADNFSIDQVTPDDQPAFQLIHDTDTYNSSDECDKPISARELYNKFNEVLTQVKFTSPELRKIAKDASSYKLDGSSEPEIIKLFEYYEAIGIDIEDNSTYTPEFEFFYNFRMFKKSTKLISSYINGSKIGRGSVWEVDPEDIENNKTLPIRKVSYDMERSMDKEYQEGKVYLMQPKWFPCSAATLRWKSGVHTLPMGQIVKGMYTSRYKGGIITAPDYCLVGDTKIKLLDGTSRTIKDICDNFSKNDSIYTYAYDKENGEIRPAKIINAQLTKYTTEIYRITLDNGEVVECTNNHPFMTRTGEYVRADELTVGQSLMPMRWRISKDHKILKGYEEIYQPSGQWEFTHHLVSGVYHGFREANSKTQLYRHHKNENKLDNRPENLELLTASEHMSLHMTEFHANRDNKARVSEWMKRAWEDGEYRTLHQESTRKQWQDPKFREKVSKHNSELMKRRLRTEKDLQKNLHSAKYGKIIRQTLDTYGEFNKENYEIVRDKRRGYPRYDTLIKIVGSYEKCIELGKNYNHKVVNIEVVNVEPIPVYDLEVENYHNFLIDLGDNSGIFVHNSQLEVRIISGIANCTPLLEAYKQGEDVHMKTACSIFNKKPEDITKVERRFCLGGNTRIRLVRGGSTYSKTIKELAESGLEDFEVYSWDIERNKEVIGHAKYARKTITTDKIWKVTFDTGRTVECTHNHRFLMIDNSYVEAQDLKLGDKVRAPFGSKEIVRIETQLIPPEDMYDIEVEKYDNFLIDFGGGSGVFVHNSKMGCHLGSTRILLPNGDTPTIQKIYEEGLASDQILSHDGNGVEMDTIHGVELTKYVDKITVVEFDDGNIIKCTDNHPFLLIDGTYEEAKNLKGKKIRTMYYRIYHDEKGLYGKVADENDLFSRKVVKVTEEILDKPTPVYDMAVEKNHNYPVLLSGEKSEFTSVFTHNTFRILYGSTPQGFAKQFLNDNVEMAQRIFDGFFNAYPEIKTWMDARHKEVEQTGKVSCDRVGYFLNIDIENDPEGLEGACRKAGNAPIQSQGSMVAGYVLANVNKYILDHGLKSKVISFIHD